jgi:flagellar FliL protein
LRPQRLAQPKGKRMAKDKDTQPEAPPQKPAGKKGLIIGVAVAGVVALAAGGGGAWFFLHHKSDEHAAQAQPKAKPSAPIFVTLEPFVVNMAGEVQHFLQLGIDLRIADSSVSEEIKLHLPEIRNGVLLLLSSKKVEDLASVEQKNRLRDEIREAANKPLGIETLVPKPSETAVGSAPPPSGAVAVKAIETPKPVATIPGSPAESGVLEVLLTSFVIQ